MLNFLRIESSGCCEKGYFEDEVRPRILKEFESKNEKYKPYFDVKIVPNANSTFRHFKYRNDPIVVYVVWTVYEGEGEDEA